MIVALVQERSRLEFVHLHGDDVHSLRRVQRSRHADVRGEGERHRRAAVAHPCHARGGLPRSAAPTATRETIR